MTVKYTEEHEWVQAGDTATVGITVHAQDALGDVVFVELPEVGKTRVQRTSRASSSWVKAAADVYMPVSGEVVEVNEALRAIRSSDRKSEARRSDCLAVASAVASDLVSCSI